MKERKREKEREGEGGGGREGGRERERERGKERERERKILAKVIRSHNLKAIDLSTARLSAKTVFTGIREIEKHVHRL